MINLELPEEVFDALFTKTLKEHYLIVKEVKSDEVLAESLRVVYNYFSIKEKHIL